MTDTTFATGQRVCGGDIPEDYDEGRVVSTTWTADDPGGAPGMILVAWDSGTRCWTPADVLRPLDA